MVYINELGDLACHPAVLAQALAEGKKVVVYTKNLTDEIKGLLLKHRAQTVLHLTITGWGGTMLEPGVPFPDTQIEAMHRLIHAGYPSERITVRLDPIIPNFDGVETAKNVLSKLPTTIPVISSILQMYDRHAKLFNMFGIDKNQYSVKSGKSTFISKDQATKIYSYINPARWHKVSVCGHPYEIQGAIHDGCINKKTLELLSLPLVETLTRQRPGCKCIGRKHQLLNYQHTCTHGCLYCYAHNNIA